jgi:translation elongation factor EF-Tu-like GTPase
MTMIRVTARIELYANGRKTPFISGYRPLFEFILGIKTSGRITTLNKQRFFPGDAGIVRIDFLNQELLGPMFGPGSKFTFGEGGKPLGEGHILKVL